MMNETLPRQLANLRILEFAAHKLEELCNEVVFLGGCTTALFITDPLFPDVRSTLDVDCIIDVISLNEYYKFSERLKQKGFRVNMNDEITCRWHCDDLILDVMPIDDTILGFSNLWYKEAIKNSTNYQLTTNKIQAVTAPYFIATKIEAFKGRGKTDYFTSHDFEDVISVLDGRSEIYGEILKSEVKLQKYLLDFLNGILRDRHFHDALPGHFSPHRSLADQRIKIFLQRLDILRRKLTIMECYNILIEKNEGINDWQKVYLAEAIESVNQLTFSKVMYNLLDLALKNKNQFAKDVETLNKIKKQTKGINLKKMIDSLKT